jgi:hypothetical protein
LIGAAIALQWLIQIGGAITANLTRRESMSGSGGGGGGPDTPVLSCEDLVIHTQIASPKAAVVSKLSVGDILDVAVQMQGGTAVVVLLFKGKQAGGLASPHLGQLRECIQNGTTYQARVTGINGAAISVSVEAV